jgi:hypothetical protein
LVVRRIAGNIVPNDPVASALRRARYYDSRVDHAKDPAAAVRAKADHLAAELRRLPPELALTASTKAIAWMAHLIADLQPTGAGNG